MQSFSTGAAYDRHTTRATSNGVRAGGSLARCFTATGDTGLRVSPVIDRQPRHERPARIAPLATLPVFFRLMGKRVLLAGGSAGAFWKAELLAATGADLHVFAQAFSEDFEQLAAEPPAGRVTLHHRGWAETDLAGAALAVADLDDAFEAERFVTAARAAGACVNVIDKPDFCAFQFGSIVNRSPLVIGISTDGAAPVFAQAIRQKIEAILPAGLAAWAEAARAWRPLVQARSLGYAARRAFWERFTQHALCARNRPPTLHDRDAMLSVIPSREGSTPEGRITLVGAGPGDPELLTMKALRLLQSADVILHDDLVTPEILELARREATRIRVGKKGHGPSCKQDDINTMMVALARGGAHVLRLKSGDPGIFGRASEEIEAARAAGIPISIVPGITAAQGAAAALGLSLTERKAARRLQFLTGHEQNGKLPDDIAWHSIADPSVTTILYMPRKTLAEFSTRARQHGLHPATPAIAVMNATRPDQHHIAATLGTLPALLRQVPVDGPTLVMIGRPFAAALPAPLAQAPCHGCLAPGG